MKGSTFEDLVQIVTMHRQSNAKDIGKPREEIEEQICQRWPSGCNSKPAKKTAFSLTKQFIQTMGHFLKSGGKTVEQNDAEARAALCVSCHNNVPSGEARGCSACGMADPALSAVHSLLGKRTSQDSRLRSCAICGCDNRIQVWMPNEALHITPENKNAYPCFCWKKDLI